MTSEPTRTRGPFESFHRGEYGRVGHGLPADDLGFVHFTREAWMASPVACRPLALLDDWGDQMVLEALDAVRRADKIVAKWRESMGPDATVPVLNVSKPSKYPASNTESRPLERGST